LQLYSILSSSSIHFPLSLGYYWFGEGVGEREGARKKGETCWRGGARTGEGRVAEGSGM
jgi:hypothetical protein